MNSIVFFFLDPAHLLVIIKKRKKGQFGCLWRKAIFWSLESWQSQTNCGRQHGAENSSVHVWLGEETRVSVFRTWRRVSWLSRESTAAAAGLIWSTFELWWGMGVGRSGWLCSRWGFGTDEYDSTPSSCWPGTSCRTWKKNTPNTCTIWCRAGFRFPQSHTETVIPSLKLACVSQSGL